MDHHQKFIRRAIELGLENIRRGAGGPFGAVVVQKSQIISEGWNAVTSTNDPTAHAEVIAIRKACEKLNSFQLTGCIIYSSCEPCPMCLGAIYWARPEMLVFSSDRKDAAFGGFDDEWLYKEILCPLPQRKIPTLQVVDELGLELFQTWNNKVDRVKY